VQVSALVGREAAAFVGHAPEPASVGFRVHGIEGLFQCPSGARTDGDKGLAVGGDCGGVGLLSGEDLSELFLLVYSNTE
jgi:hypothetical protein